MLTELLALVLTNSYFAQLVFISALLAPQVCAARWTAWAHTADWGSLSLDTVF